MSGSRSNSLSDSQTDLQAASQADPQSKSGASAGTRAGSDATPAAGPARSDSDTDSDSDATSTRAVALALVTSDVHPGIHPDDDGLVAALHAHGFATTACVWSDPAVDWARFDAILVRTTWDYFERYAQFLAWYDRLEASGVPVLNPLPLLRWNSDKRYLLDLPAHGVAIVPTTLASGAALADAARARDGDVVVKPRVSGGALHTLRGRGDDARFLADVAALPRELDYLVQPYLPEIASAGEWSLLYFDAVYSHAVLKRPRDGDYRVQPMYGGRTAATEPDAAILAAAQRALDAMAALGHGDHAYLRVDGVVVDGRFLIMELEGIEPLLYFTEQPAGAERFAAAIARRWRGLGAAANAQAAMPAAAAAATPRV